MKIYKNNKVYVTKKDITFLLLEQIEIPESIKIDIITQNNNNPNFKCTKETKNDLFVFESDEAKEFFAKFDFIVDYDSYMKLSLNELSEQFDIKAKKRMILNDMYNKMDEQEKITHQNLKKHINKLDILLEGIMDILDIFEGNSTIEIPEKETKEFLEKEERAKEFLQKMMSPINFSHFDK